MPGGGNHFDVLKTGGAQAGGDELRRALHVGGVLGQRADAGDAEKSFQFFKETIFILIDEGVGGLRHSPL